MAITGISFGERHFYGSRHDPDFDPALSEDENITKGATIFYWGAIPNIVMTRIQDGQQTSTVEVGEAMKQTFNNKSSLRNRECVKWGIREPGWKNFSNKEGPIIPEFENVLEGGQTYKVLSDNTLNKIPLSIMNEVGTEIYNGNSLTETQRKNLEDALLRLEGMPDGNALLAATNNAENEDANAPQSSKATSRKKVRKSTIGGTTRSRKNRGTAARGG